MTDQNKAQADIQFAKDRGSPSILGEQGERELESWLARVVRFVSLTFSHDPVFIDHSRLESEVQVKKALLDQTTSHHSERSVRIVQLSIPLYLLPSCSLALFISRSSLTPSPSRFAFISPSFSRNEPPNWKLSVNPPRILFLVLELDQRTSSLLPRLLSTSKLPPRTTPPRILLQPTLPRRQERGRSSFRIRKRGRELRLRRPRRRVGRKG